MLSFDLSTLHEILLDYRENTNHTKETFADALLSDERVLSLLPNAELLGEGCTACVIGFEQYAIKCYYPQIDTAFEPYTKDFEILNKLQGIPMIPKLYGGVPHLFVVQERIFGDRMDSKFYETLPLEKWELLLKTFKTIFQQGISPIDAHEENILLTNDGHFYLIDFGAYSFIKHDDCIPNILEFNHDVVIKWKKSSSH